MLEEKKDVNIDSTNIFDEFIGDDNLKEEVKKIKMSKEKNSYYYLGVFNKFLSGLNTFIILSFFLLGGYIYIQNSEKFNDMPYFESFCGIFVNDSFGTCSSVSYLISYKDKKYSTEKLDYYKANLGLIGDVYYVSNLIFSKDVSFLLNKTENKLRPLVILEEFDKLKNDFEPINKSKLRCFNIEIKNDYTVSMDCSAYSGNWDSRILGKSGKDRLNGNVSGTSISVASSFINFLEKKEGSKFSIVDKQKMFATSDIVDLNGYTKKTNFKLKLIYKNNNILLDKK